MKNILFLGSGISIASGMPSVGEISEHLLEKPYNFVKGPPYSFAETQKASYIEDPTIKRIRDLFRLIINIEQDLLKASAPFTSKERTKNTGALFKGDTTYEDLYYIISEIAQSSMALSKKATTSTMILYIEDKGKHLLKGNNPSKRMIDLGKLCNMAVRFLDWLVPRLLVEKEPKGLDLVIEVIRHNPNIDIITLNHDTLIERLLDHHLIEYDDGFHKKIEDGLLAYKGFKSHSPTKIIKPHGSTNWKSKNHKYFKQITGSNNTPSQKLKSELLTGTNKILSYNRGIFAEMFYQLHQSFKESNCMIMSGYGWGDEGINIRLGNWLDRNGTNLVILHENPESLQDRSFQLMVNMDNLVKSGKLILVKKWLSDTTLDMIQQEIN